MASAAAIFQFRSRFSEFDDPTNVSDADIADALDMAAFWIEVDMWSPRDYPLAILYWAAHTLSIKQMQLASTQLGGTGETDLFLGSVSFGERRVQFRQRRTDKSAESFAGPGESMLDVTVYGQYYLMLRTRNIIPIAIV